MVDLGRVDLCYEVYMMSLQLALPCEGHLKEMFHIFDYLRKYHHYEMVFYTSDPVVGERQFEEKYWTASEFGSHTKEELPANMPIPKGFGFVIRDYVDANHAGDPITCRSRTGMYMF